MRLTRVVLPAPFDPMSASTSPSVTVKSTWSTAWVSPKDLRELLGLRECHDAGRPCRTHGASRIDRAHDAGGQREHQHDQHDPEHHLPVHRVPDGIGLEVIEDDRAHDGAEEGPEAAEHGEETILPENGQCRMSGVVSPFSGTQSAPASPVKIARDHEGDPARVPAPAPRGTPRASRCRGSACRALPNGEWTMTHIRATQSDEDREHIIVVPVGEEVDLVLPAAARSSPCRPAASASARGGRRCPR